MVWIIGIVFGILGLVAFGLRVAARVFKGTHTTWGPEDWVMTVAVVSLPIRSTLCADRQLTSTQALMIPLAVLSVPREYCSVLSFHIGQ